LISILPSSVSCRLRSLRSATRSNYRRANKDGQYEPSGGPQYGLDKVKGTGQRMVVRPAEPASRWRLIQND
jgi:hypothetical protein